MPSLESATNYHFQYAVLVNTTQEKAWDLLTDVSRWKEWDTELVDAELSGDFALGAKGVLRPKKGPRLRFHISELTATTSYTFVTKMPVGTLEIKRTLKNIENQVEFTDDIKFTGFLKQFFGRILGSGFKTVLPEVMNNFKKIAEKE
ncbi:MAG: SRPBCC family protein [Bacteroidota bacterium]